MRRGDFNERCECTLNKRRDHLLSTAMRCESIHWKEAGPCCTEPSGRSCGLGTQVEAILLAPLWMAHLPIARRLEEWLA